MFPNLLTIRRKPKNRGGGVASNAGTEQVSDDNTPKQAPKSEVKTVSAQKPAEPTKAGETPAQTGMDFKKAGEEYLKNDTEYQQRKKEIDDAKSRISQIEKETANLAKKYPDIKDAMKKLMEEGDLDLESNRLTADIALEEPDLTMYEAVMTNWRDGIDGKSKHTVYKGNIGTDYIIKERVTLANGKRAYITDKGAFYPGNNGNIDPANPVPQDLLPKKELPKA